jgi:6-phosphogluconate dehydrogenase
VNKLAENWKTTALPSELVEIIEKILKEHPELGYKSVAEFVKDAVRRRIETIQTFVEETKKEA